MFPTPPGRYLSCALPALLALVHGVPPVAAAPLLTLSKGPADHLYLADKELLVVPMFFDDVVRAWHWAPDAKPE
jgi:hypothetical protein